MNRSRDTVYYEGVEKTLEKYRPDVIATHLDSVNHALVTSRDVKEFAQNHGLNNLCVPANGEQITL